MIFMYNVQDGHQFVQFYIIKDVSKAFMPSLLIVVQVSNKVNLIAIDVAWKF